MNLFSTDLFLQTLAASRFPGRRWSVDLYRVEGQCFRLLAVDGRPVISAPFLDFFEPLSSPPPEAPRPLKYLPAVALATTSADARDPAMRPSPFIDWSLYPTWEGFEAAVALRPDSQLSTFARKHRKLGREVGPVRFEFADARPEVFDRCVQWKSAQYIASEFHDLFADLPNLRLFRELQRLGPVVVSSLTAGETLVAAHIGAVHDGRLYFWVPAYDPAYSKYSPGRLLLWELMRASQGLGHREFDFLVGGEEYKWHFATHSRAIGPLGAPPWPLRLRQEGKRRLKAALGRFPAALETARRMKKRLGR